MHTHALHEGGRGHARAANVLPGRGRINKSVPDQRSKRSDLPAWRARHWRRRRSHGRRIPVLVGFAVDEAPGVEPRRRVALAGTARVRVVARPDHRDEVVLGADGHDLRGQPVALSHARHAHALREEDTTPSRPELAFGLCWM